MQHLLNGNKIIVKKTWNTENLKVTTIRITETSTKTILSGRACIASSALHASRYCNYHTEQHNWSNFWINFCKTTSIFTRTGHVLLSISCTRWTRTPVLQGANGCKNCRFAPNKWIPEWKKRFSVVVTGKSNIKYELRKLGAKQAMLVFDQRWCRLVKLIGDQPAAVRPNYQCEARTHGKHGHFSVA